MEFSNYYHVTVRFRTKRGNPSFWSGNFFASSIHHAQIRAAERVKGDGRLRHDGGSLTTHATAYAAGYQPTNYF